MTLLNDLVERRRISALTAQVSALETTLTDAPIALFERLTAQQFVRSKRTRERPWSASKAQAGRLIHLFRNTIDAMVLARQQGRDPFDFLVHTAVRRSGITRAPRAVTHNPDRRFRPGHTFANLQRTTARQQADIKGGAGRRRAVVPYLHLLTGAGMRPVMDRLFGCVKVGSIWRRCRNG